MTSGDSLGTPPSRNREGAEVEGEDTVLHVWNQQLGHAVHAVGAA